MCKIEPAASERVNGFKVELYQDTDAESPREWDNLGTMACWHNRYNLGDVQPSDNPQEWQRSLAEDSDTSLAEQIDYWQEGEGFRTISRKYKNDKAIYEKVDAIVRGLISKSFDSNVPVILPLFLYDHSGITMSTSNRDWPFCDRWDSGQVGWIYATAEKIKQEYGDLSAESIKKAHDLLVAEVETYDQYLTEDVWGYVVKCVSCGTVLDSCWGFFGSDYAMSEGKSAAENLPACCEIVEDLAECEEEDY